MTITVYKTPTCVQCPPTIRHLEKHELVADIITIDRAADAPEDVQALGYMQAPIVTVRNDDGVIVDHWSGFRPDKIDRLAAA